MFVFGTEAGRGFLAAYPGETELPSWAPIGQPGWAQWQHWLNAFLMLLIIKTGWTIRRTTRPTAMWSPKSGGMKISIEVFTHVFLDVLWLANGAIFWVLLFATGQWIRVVPFSWDFIPNAISAALQYASMSWPAENGWVNYNSLQVIAYFSMIFIVAPLAAATGFRMSPLWPKRAQRLSKAFPIEAARAVHFPVMLVFVGFMVIHVVLVFATGALRNLNHMFWGTDDAASWVGLCVFLAGTVVMVAGWYAVQPKVFAFIGAALGKVGR